MEIPMFPELTFEEGTHTYKLNGIEIPSVTTLMQPLSRKVYGDTDPDVLARAAARGTAVHQAAENYARFGIEDIAPEFSGYFEAFKSWWDEKKPVILGTECRVYHKTLGYAGTCDLLCIINDQITLVDYKTTATVEHMLTMVQLEGYDRAWESQGVKIDRREILQLQNSGRHTETIYPRNPECWRVISVLMTLKNSMNKF